MPKETIEVIAQSIGITNLSSDAALALAPDVEYRIREIMQEAIKCMRHSKRTILMREDVDGAFGLRNVEPVYGFASGGHLQFKRALGHRDLFYIDDRDVDFKDVIDSLLPKAPLDTAISCHWLAIEGVQPAIPENAPVGAVAAPSTCKNNDQKDGHPADIKLPVKHILSRELQLYFDKISELTVSKSDSILFKEALVSLATDSGLHPLVPYFTHFIADEVSRGLHDYSLLFALMRIVRSLLHNPHIHIEPYLHQLMPSVVTCLVSKKLGNRSADNHWELRDFTAKLVASVCKRYGHVYITLQTRLTKTLVNTLLDPKRSLTQHYGAIQGLAALGPKVVHLFILPNLEPYLRLLEPEMLLDTQKNATKRYEARQVYRALLCAAGRCIYDRLKIFPPFSSPPGTACKRNAKVVFTDKRKASTEGMETEPPLKRREIDGPASEQTNPSSPRKLVEGIIASPPSGDSAAGQSSFAGKRIDDGSLGSRGGKTKGDSQPLKTAAILKQVWEEDLSFGQLLVQLFELFGEGILSFIPAPEMSIFI